MIQMRHQPIPLASQPAGRSYLPKRSRRNLRCILDVEDLRRLYKTDPDNLLSHGQRIHSYPAYQTAKHGTCM